LPGPAGWSEAENSVTFSVLLKFVLHEAGGDAASGVVFCFLGAGIEDGKGAVGIAVELEVVGGVGTIGISDVFVSRVVIVTARDRKMQLPNIFEMASGLLARQSKTPSSVQKSRAKLWLVDLRPYP
jgi:hypothetical protein